MERKSILAVDDSISNLKLLESMLYQHGYQVRVADNGRSALTSIVTKPPDLILLDIRMPGMDGFEVCQQIKKNHQIAHIPIVFLSALTEPRDIIKALQAGGVDYITKPFREQEVLARIKNHLELAELRKELIHLTENLEQVVKIRTGELAESNDQLRQEIAQREKTEEALSRELEMNRAIAEMSGSLVAASANLNEITDLTLKYALLLTRSKNGFVSIIDADTQDQVIYSQSLEFQNDNITPGQAFDRFSVDVDGQYSGLLGHALNTRQAFFINKLEGHELSRSLSSDLYPINRFLSIPAMVGGELLGQVCLANCPEEYSNTHVEIGLQLAVLFAVAVNRKRLDDKLRESEQRFQMIADYAHGWETWTSPEDQLIWTNPGIERVTGYTAEEFLTLKSPLKQLVFEEDYPEISEIVQKCQTNRSAQNDILFRIRRKDDSVRWASISIQPIYSSTGEYLGLRSSVRDIHHRKMAEQSLKKSQDRLQTLLKLSQMTELSEQNLADYALEEAVRLTGSQEGYLHFYDEDLENILLKSWSNDALKQTILPDNYRYPLEEIGPWADCARKRRPVVQSCSEMKQNHKGLPEGHFPIIRHMSIPVFDGKKITAIAGVANKKTDYTQSDIDQFSLLMSHTWQIIQKKITERQLEENEKQLRIIFDQAPMGIALTDAETGKFFKVNSEFSVLSGYSEDELQEMDTQSLIHPDDYEKTRDRRLALREKKLSHYSLEKRYVRKDGSLIWVNVTVVPLSDEDAFSGQNLSMVEDISERKEAERALRTSEGSLRALASKLQETEESFRKELSRELHDQAGQSLTALNLNLTLLENQLQSGQVDKMQEKLADSIALVEETTRTIRDVMSDLRPAVLDDYGLRAALCWHCKRFSKRTNIKVNIQDVQLSSRLPEPVESALFRIYQEAMNNVSKHAGADQVWVSLDDSTEYLCLLIKDNGVGFDTGKFELSMGRRGWGILNMTERVQALGGAADISSEPGKGTIVSVKIRKNEYEN